MEAWNFTPSDMAMAEMKGNRIATRQRTTTILRILFLMILPTAVSNRFRCLSISLTSCESVRYEEQSKRSCHYFSVYEKSAECPAIYGGDECGAGARGMQSPSTLFKMPRVSTRGDSLND
jgi:hypothetical protein